MAHVDIDVIAANYKQWGLLYFFLSLVQPLTDSYRFKRLLASFKLLLGILTPQSGSLTGEELLPYTIPYVPPPNPYIKRREGTPAPTPTPSPPPVAPRRLIRALLDARGEATRAMWSFMIDSKYQSESGLVSTTRDEVWLQVGPTKPQHVHSVQL